MVDLGSIGAALPNIGHYMVGGYHPSDANEMMAFLDLKSFLFYEVGLSSSDYTIEEYNAILTLVERAITT